MKMTFLKSLGGLVLGLTALFSFNSCEKTSAPAAEMADIKATDGSIPGDDRSGESVFLVFDEESIDNGNPPNNFSATAVNDQIARVGQRQTLRFFRENIGRTIDLYTGEVGDEGWHALKT